MKLRWPKGRYNGRPITGFSLKLKIDLSWWHWIPRFSWGFGQPVAFWLCLSLRADPVYHFNH